MTQAQIDIQTQLEQATPTDLITRPLSNDSPVLYIETFLLLQLFLNKWNTQKLNTKIQNLLLQKMILIIHNRHHLLQKNDMKL